MSNKERKIVAVIGIALGVTLCFYITYRYVNDIFFVKSTSAVIGDRIVYSPLIILLSFGLIIGGIFDLNGYNKRNEKLLQEKEEQRWRELKKLDKLFETKMNSNKKNNKKRKNNQ